MLQSGRADEPRPRMSASLPPPPQALLKPLARLLRPLVRLMIRSGVTFPVVAELLRGLYVDVATRDLLADPKAQTDSRISLLTGVHRKEIRRLRTEAPAPEGVPEVVTLASQIIARWLAAPPYADAGGRPRPCRAPPGTPARPRSRGWSNRSPRMCGPGRCWTTGSTRGSCRWTTRAACI